MTINCGKCLATFTDSKAFRVHCCAKPPTKP
jgi:hypothetical protein